MFSKIKNALTSKKAKQITDVRNIGLYVFCLVVLAIAWSGAKTVQSNYELQKKISTLKQENDILWLQNSNTYLQNQYYKTNQYQELSARQNLGLAAPGEQVLLVPKDVALRYVDPKLEKNVSTKAQPPDNRATYVKNIEAWRDFLLGRNPSIN